MPFPVIDMQFLTDGTGLEDTVDHFRAVHFPERMLFGLRQEKGEERFPDRLEEILFILLHLLVIKRIAFTERNHRVLPALEGDDRNLRIGQDGRIRDGSPEIGDGADLTTPQQRRTGRRHGVRRLRALGKEFRQVLLPHISQVQGRDGPGIGPAGENPTFMDHEGVPLQEEPDRRVGILQGPVLDVIRRTDIPPVSLAVIDGRDHIAQGSEMPAPFHEGRVPFVAPPERTAMEGHEQRAVVRPVILRIIQVHGQVLRLRLFVIPVDDPTIHDILRLPYLPDRVHIQVQFRKRMIGRNFIGFEDDRLYDAVTGGHLPALPVTGQGYGDRIGLHPTDIAVQKSGRFSQRVKTDPQETVLHLIEPWLHAAGAGAETQQCQRGNPGFHPSI